MDNISPREPPTCEPPTCEPPTEPPARESRDPNPYPENTHTKINFLFIDPVPSDASIEIISGIQYLCKKYFETTLIQEFGFDPSYQDLDTELDDLPGRYSTENNGTMVYCYYLSDSVHIPVGVLGIKDISDRFANPQNEENKKYLKNTDSNWLNLFVQNPKLKIGELKRMFIDVPFRGNGLAKQILKKVLDRGNTLHFDFLVLDTLKDMHAARNLYEKFGFSKCHPYVYNPSTDVVFYGLALGLNSSSLNILLQQ